MIFPRIILVTRRENPCVCCVVARFLPLLLSETGKKQLTCKSIVQFENESDALKHNPHQHLPKGLCLPVPRNDLLTLLTK